MGRIHDIPAAQVLKNGFKSHLQNTSRHVIKKEYNAAKRSLCKKEI